MFLTVIITKRRIKNFNIECYLFMLKFSMRLVYLSIIDFLMLLWIRVIPNGHRYKVWLAYVLQCLLPL